MSLSSRCRHGPCTSYTVVVSWAPPQVPAAAASVRKEGGAFASAYHVTKRDVVFAMPQLRLKRPGSCRCAWVVQLRNHVPGTHRPAGPICSPERALAGLYVCMHIHV
ncbi:hypothetical protein VTI74DRAFT_9261 [Chaetomium olivicolor]